VKTPSSVPHLSDGVVVGPLDEDGAAVRVLHVLHKRVLLLSQHVLVHSASVALRSDIENEQMQHTCDTEYTEVK
jgi:hypothetical protein